MQSEVSMLNVVVQIGDWPVLRAFIDMMEWFARMSRKLERDTEVTCGLVLKYWVRTIDYLDECVDSTSTGAQPQLRSFAKGICDKLVKELANDKWYVYGIVSAAYLDLGGE